MICELCSQDKQLSNSHIIPEFIYEHSELYDGKHRYHVLSTKPDTKNEFEQKGIREKLLCPSCENKFSAFETYTKNVLFDAAEIKTVDKGKGKLVFENIDYKKFKLFQLSVLWRASVSTLEMFNEIDLGLHEPYIRDMLWNENPGKSTDYGCIYRKISSRDEDFEATQIIGKPTQMAKIDGHRTFVFLMAGLFWVYIVSSHMQDFIHKKYFIQENGTLLINLKPVPAEKVFKGFAQTLYKQGKLDM